MGKMTKLRSNSSIGININYLYPIFSLSPAISGSGKIFDFNATLPIMGVQFSALLLFLENSWFKPVGNLLDERDKKLSKGLKGVSSIRTELEILQAESAIILKEARAEAKNLITKTKKNVREKLGTILNFEIIHNRNEMKASMKELEFERGSAMILINKKTSKITNVIILKVLPEGLSYKDSILFLVFN